MSNKPKDIVVAGNQGIAKIEEVPEFLRSEIGHYAGMEKVEQSDILLPRLGLCQALSPQKRKSNSAYIEGLQEGQLFNTVTQEIYGEELDIIPLFFFKNRIKFNPLDEGGGIDCQSKNAIDGGRINRLCSACQYSVWGNGMRDGDGANKPPLCTIYHNFMSFIPADMTPIAISYKSSGLRLSKQLLAQQRLARLPMYAKFYRINVVTMKDGDNEWYEKKIVPSKFVDKIMFDEMERQFAALKEMDITVDTTGESEGDTSFNEGANSHVEM